VQTNKSRTSAEGDLPAREKNARTVLDTTSCDFGIGLAGFDHMDVLCDFAIEGQLRFSQYDNE